MRGIGIVLTLLIAAIVGVGAYQLGVSQGLATTGTAVAPALRGTFSAHSLPLSGHSGFGQKSSKSHGGSGSSKRSA